jgi:hypothetical protein
LDARLDGPALLKKNYCHEIQICENRKQSGRIFKGPLWLKKGCFASDDDELMMVYEHVIYNTATFPHELQSKRYENILINIFIMKHKTYRICSLACLFMSSRNKGLKANRKQPRHRSALRSNIMISLRNTAI